MLNCVCAYTEYFVKVTDCFIFPAKVGMTKELNLLPVYSHRNVSLLTFPLPALGAMPPVFDTWLQQTGREAHESSVFIFHRSADFLPPPDQHDTAVIIND